MSATSQSQIDADTAWDQYQHNFSRHLLGVARHLQTIMMKTLQEQYGHKDLRLSFAPYITLIGEEDMRLTDLAEILNISRQACNQAAKQIENAGYIARTADPVDGRAKQLTLSTRGMELRNDGVRIVAEMDDQFAQLVGETAMQQSSQALRALYKHLDLGLRPERNNAQYQHIVMGGLLPRLADYILQRLMELTRAKGHPGLKLSFGQVLPLIGPSGGRIQQIAAAHDVSKQAISAIATELEELGYLRRDADTTDARQLVLRFTPGGEQLIADSVASVIEMEAEFIAILGEDAFRAMVGTFDTLYQGLDLEQDVFGKRGAVDITLLAQQLKQQLGSRGSQQLAALLLNPSD
ncbi:MAG: DNA-binding MarR family transcriptional regulator [Halioglobus sp.]|jgi:DNA-binding MarR family transcriptional regulator